MTNVVRPMLAPLPKLNKPMLAFAAPSFELAVLEPDYPYIQSVSLYGQYSGDHIIGVDARDLTRFEDRSFSGSFGILVFDFFLEQEKALEKSARVIEDGGLFLQQFGAYRLTEGNDPPSLVDAIKKRDDYYIYLPDDHGLVSISMGIGWYVSAMERAGFDAQHVQYDDPHTGQANHWFIGIRRGR